MAETPEEATAQTPDATVTDAPAESAGSTTTATVQKSQPADKTGSAAKKAAPAKTSVPELFGQPVVVGRASARYVRMSPTKVRRVVDLIRGLPAAEAQAIVSFDPHAAAEPVKKVLDSAVANAEHLAHVRSQRLDPADLVVSEAFVDEGPTLKRFRPRAQGRAYRIRKRTSHITVVVTPEQLEGTR